MMKRGKRVLGLDIGSAYVKAVELETRNDAYSVTAYGMAEVVGDDRNAALRNLLRDTAFATRRVVTSVSGRAVTVRYLTMPAMAEEQLRKTLPQEADKYLPYEPNECFLDGHKLDIPASAPTEMWVLMVASKKGVVQDLLNLLEGVQLPPMVVDVDAFALGNAFEMSEVTGGRQPTEDVVALVDIGATKTDVNIIQKNVTHFTREVYVGGHRFTEGIVKRYGVDPAQAEEMKQNPGDKKAEVLETLAPAFEELRKEIRHSFDYFESQFEREVGKILLSGGGARMEGLPETLESLLGKPVEFWDPVAGLPMAEGVDPSLLQARASQFAVAIGLASRLREMK